MKKITTLIIAAALALSISACWNTTTPTEETTEKTEVTTEASEATEETKETKGVETPDETKPTENTDHDDHHVRPDSVRPDETKPGDFEDNHYIDSTDIYDDEGDHSSRHDTFPGTERESVEYDENGQAVDEPEETKPSVPRKVNDEGSEF